MLFRILAHIVKFVFNLIGENKQVFFSVLKSSSISAVINYSAIVILNEIFIVNP
jgi:hypothetical protein